MTPRDAAEAKALVELRKMQLCAASLAYADEASAFDLCLAATRYAESVRTFREMQREEARA